MRIDVYFTPAELSAVELPEQVVIIDVLRATSTMAEALANGARAILPVATADDAVRIAQNIGRDSVLLCGERKGLAIDGFDLGNAPVEFSAERVEDMTLVMTTTNGTRAVLTVAERQGVASEDGRVAVLAGSYLNLAAVARQLIDGGTDAAVVCAGREGRFALEDAVCAGHLVRTVEAAGQTVEPNDAARASLRLADEAASVESLLEATAAGRNLMALGRGEDLAFCAQLDRTERVPRLRGRRITLE